MAGPPAVFKEVLEKIPGTGEEVRRADLLNGKGKR
jgi:hypothetical protein